MSVVESAAVLKNTTDEAAEARLVKDEAGKWITRPDGAAPLFQKGRSGNPGGRPKGASIQGPFLRALARGHEDDPDGYGKLAVEAGETLARATVAGDADTVRAILPVLERTDGPIERTVAEQLSALPRIIIQGPQSAGAVGDCITVEGSVQSPLAVACEPIGAGVSTDNRERIDASLAAPGAYASSATKRMESEASAIAARAKDDAIDELRAQVAALTASVAQLASIVAASQRVAS